MEASSLRIVFVLPTYLPETFGGGEQQARKIAQALSRRGLAVTILAPRLSRTSQRREIDGKVQIRRFRLRRAPNLGGRHIASFLQWSTKLIFWLWRHRNEYDVIHIVHGRLHAVPAVLAGRLIGRPTLVKIGRGGETFDLDVVNKKRLLGTQFARVIQRHACRYIANSREISIDLRRWNIKESRICRIPNGVELPQLEACSHSTQGPRLVYLGRLDPEKAIDMMIRVFSRLSTSYGAQLTIVGDGPCRAELEALVKSAGLEEKVTFTGALLDVGPVLRESNIFVSTSTSEGMSNALLEAMSYAVVPLVSKVSGVADIVEDGNSGFVFALGDPNAFEAKLKGAVELTPEARRSFGNAARKKVQQEFDIEEIAERHIALYRELGSELTKKKYKHCNFK